jgi:carboxyl-terminal processing protease
VEPEFEAIKEADLSRHLDNGEAGATAKPAAESGAEKKESLANEDYQLYEALNLLKGLNILKQTR